ncbi:MAG: methylglyoxal reductase (NADPH-dependent) gre2 [Cirrosporium novae-zelandiae]|nr:MAG: methylglyoxal reductase (NADPH-dependent) gre2 [Cirrosporium novae-zelandiae]
MRVLLTGGSGFIAAHVLDTLLQRGHSVVTSVRSLEKAKQIQAAHPDIPKSKLDFAIVEDIAQPGAFDEAVKSDPHGIAVITSSFAAMLDSSKGHWPTHTYNESSWNPVTISDASKDPATGYRASKTHAEKAAWDFVATSQPNFTLATINPPMVFGPIIHNLSTLTTLNTSNQLFRDLIQGVHKNGPIPPNGTFIWVDVRDVALAHVRAMEVPEAGGKRFFATAGHYSNKEIVEIIRQDFPQFADGLPGKEMEGNFPEEIYKVDMERVRGVLGIEFRDLRSTVVDTVRSLEAVGV